MKSAFESNKSMAYAFVQVFYTIYVVCRIPYTIIVHGRAGLKEAILLFISIFVIQIVCILILSAIDAVNKRITNRQIRNVEHQIESLQTQAEPFRDRIRTLSDKKKSVLRQLEQLR